MSGDVSVRYRTDAPVPIVAGRGGSEVSRAADRRAVADSGSSAAESDQVVASNTGAGWSRPGNQHGGC